MTTTSLNFREAVNAPETGRVPIALITLSHDDLGDISESAQTPREN